MAFSTEELIQIGLVVGIIIVFGLVIYNYLKNKGTFEKRKEEKKSLSFTKNRKMRGLEKLIPEKKLSNKPTMTEIKFENGLWEPDEIELKKEDLIKKKEEKEEPLLKEEKINKTEVSLAEIKPKGKFSFKSPFERKTEEKTIQITPKEKKQEKTELKPLAEIKPKGKFAFNKIISRKKEEKTIQPKEEEKYAQVGKKLEEKIKEMEEKKKSEKAVDLFALPEDKGTGKTAARKIIEGIKPEPKLFRSQEEKEKHEKKFVQKILDSQEDELESISKAIETKPDEKWNKEKEETIKALRKEFEEIDKKEDLWTEKKEKAEEGQKKEIMETKKEKQEEKQHKEKETKKKEQPLAEIELNGKFAFKKEHIEQKKELKKNKGFNEEMKKLLEEKRKKIKKQKEKTFEPKKIMLETKIKKEEIFIQPKPETKKPVLKEKEEEIIPETLNTQEPAKTGKYTFEPTQEEIEIKKTEKKEKIKKKGFLERFGIDTKKVKLTKEEEEKAQKIMIVLKEKKAEYSKEDMIEAMKNLGYSEKITQEVLRRLYE
jgi:hypothetical protein